MATAHEQSVPASWALSTISEITIPVDKVSQTESPEKTIRYIDISGIDNINYRIGGHKSYQLSDAPSRARQIVKTGDVLFSTVRPYLKNIAFVPDTYDGEIASTGFSVLRTISGISPKYLFNFCLSRDFIASLSEDQYGVSYPAVKDSQVRAKNIPVPPLNEQTRIVEKIEELFSELDKGVESLKTAQQQLKVYHQALLKQAFEGKLTEQWRAANPDKVIPAEQLLANIQAEREARYQQQLDDWKQAVKTWATAGKEGKKPIKPKKPEDISSICSSECELPATPENWIWVRYGGICEIVRNGISKKPVGDAGDKIFRISAVRPMFCDMKDYRYIQNIENEYDAYYLEQGDLLFTRYNGSRRYVGVGAEYKSQEKRLFPDKLIQTRIAIKSISSSFMEKAVNSGFSRKSLEVFIRTTAGQSGVSGGDIKNIPVPVCAFEEQITILEILDEQFSVIDKMEVDIQTNLKKSEALRQSILKKAFSGQLVPQDPTDEPASKLLARIRKEREAAEQAARQAKANAKKTAPKRSPKSMKSNKATAA